MWNLKKGDGDLWFGELTPGVIKTTLFSGIATGRMRDGEAEIEYELSFGGEDCVWVPRDCILVPFSIILRGENEDGR